MKRIVLVLPLLALAPLLAVRAEDPATNAPVAGAAEFNGLHERIIPDLAVGWNEATITEAASWLEDTARDWLVRGPSGGELRILVAPCAGEESFGTNEEPRVSYATPIGERVRTYSFVEVAKLAAEAAGMHLSVRPDCIIVHGAFEEGTYGRSLVEIPAGFREAVLRETSGGDFPDDGSRVRAFFAARGVEWPEGTVAEPVPTNEWVAMKLVQTSEHLARIRAILAAPGFSVRTVPLRPRLLEFETGHAPADLPYLPYYDRNLIVLRIPAAQLPAVAAAFADADGAAVRDLVPLRGEDGLPTLWDDRPGRASPDGSQRMVLPAVNGVRGWEPDDDAAGVTLEVVPRFSADGSALSLHYVLRSLSERPAGAAPPTASDEDSFFSIPARAAPLAPPYGCAGDVDLDPGDAVLVGNLRAPRRAGDSPRSLALLLETSARSPAADEPHTEPAPHAENA
ncbi:MAG: hypothetical protein IJL06_04915, partial [Kiritimatiellae bacterium]|nr:hypothetical protein [Kiritimatiellia bacterium]